MSVASINDYVLFDESTGFSGLTSQFFTFQQASIATILFVVLCWLITCFLYCFSPLFDAFYDVPLISKNVIIPSLSIYLFF